MRYEWILVLLLAGCPAAPDGAATAAGSATRLGDMTARVTTTVPTPPPPAQPRPLAADGPLTPETQAREDLLFAGRVRLAERDYTGALERFEAVIDRWGAHPDGYSHRAAVRASVGEYEAALEDYDRALALLPEGDPRRERTAHLRTNVAQSAEQARATGGAQR